MRPTIRLASSPEIRRREDKYLTCTLAARITELVGPDGMLFSTYLGDSGWAERRGPYWFAVDIALVEPATPLDSPHQPRLRVYHVGEDPPWMRSSSREWWKAPPTIELVGGPVAQKLFEAVAGHRAYVGEIVLSMLSELKAKGRADAVPPS
jgi:hypothetical protein